MHSVGELVICLGDCNGHVVRHVDGVDDYASHIHGQKGKKRGR